MGRMMFKDKCRKIHEGGCISFKLRIGFVILISLSYNMFIYKFLLGDRGFRWETQLFTFVTFFITSEMILFFDIFISKWFTLYSDIRKRIISFLLFVVVWIGLIRFVLSMIEPDFLVPALEDKKIFNLATAVGILYILIYVAIIIARNYHQTLSFYVVENERLKQEKIETDYKALQDQVNPHFLFNNLSTLIAIIRKDKDSAIEFTENFTDVYRYVLNSNKELSVTLKDELMFLESYIALHKARIGDGVKISIDVNEQLLEKHIPPLSLQMLVENAIKHNITSRSQPLDIVVKSVGEEVVVSNNLQLKEATYSTNTGLDNLNKRFEILTDRKINVDVGEEFYTVMIPLLSPA